MFCYNVDICFKKGVKHGRIRKNDLQKVVRGRSREIEKEGVIPLSPTTSAPVFRLWLV